MKADDLYLKSVAFSKRKTVCASSGFRRQVDGIDAVLGSDAACSGVLVRFLTLEKMGLTGSVETSVKILPMCGA